MEPNGPFRTKLVEWIRLVENWLSEPDDSVQLQQWLESAEELADSFEFTPEEEGVVEHIVEVYEAQFRAKLSRPPSVTSGLPSTEQLDALLQQKQTEQRTPEWYRQMSEIISASELGQLFAAPRQRAKLVLSKTVPPVPRNQALAVYSDQMSAFDWGIRFEPVVKQIYEARYNVTLKELGRLHHPTNPMCTASPDGLVYHCPKGLRTGRLVEIKCPVTRDIDGNISKDYYTQMQMQLHVTGLTHCDFVEVEFASPYAQLSPKQGPSTDSGTIALVYTPPPQTQSKSEPNDEKKEWSSQPTGRFHYEYSPINAPSDWAPMLVGDAEVVEWIPWRLMKWCEQLVVRNEEWWVSLQLILRTFWEDVERAKQGLFTVPESTRPTKKAKTTADVCRIQFQIQKLDEHGNPFRPEPVQEEMPDTCSEPAPAEAPSSGPDILACTDSSIDGSFPFSPSVPPYPSHNMSDS